MAKQPEYRYNPLDFEPDVAVGVLLPFNGDAPGRTFNQNYASGSVSGASVFAQSYSTEDQAISNLKNLLLTRKGERFMQPDFGTRIFDSLFETIITGDVSIVPEGKAPKKYQTLKDGEEMDI